MRPILLKGHERSITFLVYNKEGDILFTASKAPSFAVWYSDNGERIGTYNGHSGSVWSVDVDRNTNKVISGSADTYTKLWEVETGKELMSWSHKAPVRKVKYSLGDKTFLSVTDQVLGFLPTICLWDLSSDNHRPALEIQGPNEVKILDARWSPTNEVILTAHEDGAVRAYDTRNGKIIHEIRDHQKAVMQINYSKEHDFFITASKDGTAKLYDASTYKHLKTYNTGRPVNSASISPIKQEIILGGGQAADTVTTTRVDNSQFKVKFFHMVYDYIEMGTVAGHFGPVNVLSYSPDGQSFSSGGEDGYVRIHHFDPSYFQKLGDDYFDTYKSKTNF